MDEETKDNIMQQLGMEIEAIIEEVFDSRILVKDGIEKMCDASFYFPGEAKLLISGSVKIRVEFPSDDVALETEEQTFNMPMDMDLQEKCRHTPDWSTVCQADGAPNVIDVTCSKCGVSGSYEAKPYTVQW